MRQKILLAVSIIVAFVYACWSWILAAPGLVLSTNKIYWQVQTFLWDNFYSQRLLITSVYTLLIICLFSLFLLAKKSIHFTAKKFWIGFLLLSLPFLCAYNALSADIFNYLFNVKMIKVYHANPHLQPATDFATDDWVRFMHNIHTPAPYGYGFTAATTLVLYGLIEKFTLSFLCWRVINWLVLSLAIYLLSLLQKNYLGRVDYDKLFLFAFNPLILIEIIANAHNDMWMMVPLLWSFLLISAPYLRKKFWLKISGSVTLFIVSLTIKYATLALLPLYVGLLIYRVSQHQKWSGQVINQKWEKIVYFFTQNFWELCLFAMFVPLIVTEQSKFFLPWYLSWSLCFLPLIKRKQLVALWHLLAFCSLMRYLPFLLENGSSPEILLVQQCISLLPAALYTIIIVYIKLKNYVKNH